MFKQCQAPFCANANNVCDWREHCPAFETDATPTALPIAPGETRLDVDVIGQLLDGVEVVEISFTS